MTFGHITSLDDRGGRGGGPERGLRDLAAPRSQTFGLTHRHASSHCLV